MSSGSRSYHATVPYIRETYGGRPARWYVSEDTTKLVRVYSEAWGFPIGTHTGGPPGTIYPATDAWLDRDNYVGGMDVSTVYITPKSRITSIPGFQYTGKMTKVSSSGAGKVSGLAALSKTRLNGVDLNLSVILGEGKETLALIAGTAIRLTQSYKMLRKGNFEGALRELGTSPSRRQKSSIRDLVDERNYAKAWLAAQFGWKPLVTDVHTAVTREWKRLEEGTKVRGFAQEKGSINPDGSYKSGARAGWYGKVQNPDLVYKQALGLLNPVHTAWQLLPFSFVVDWFFGVSKILEGMTSTAGINDLYSWYLYEDSEDRYWDGHHMRRLVFVKRFQGRPPETPIQTRSDMGAWHVASALALMASVFKR